jgi:hypothetical protein
MAQKVAIKKTSGKKERWIHGELLIKRYAISQVLLETSVADDLPAFNENDERFVDEMRMKFRDPSGFTIARIFLDIIIGTFAIPNPLPGHGNRKASHNRYSSILSIAS